MLVSEFTQGKDLKLIALQDAPLKVSLLFLPRRNPSPEALSLSSSGESEEKSMGSDPKMSTAPKITTGKLSSKRLPSLKLPATFPTLIPKGKTSTMSWNDQVSAEEGRDLVFGLETAPQAI